MGLRESLRRYFKIEDEAMLTLEEMAESRILGEILRDSRAPELLMEEKNSRWGGLGEIIRAEELIKLDNDGYRFETALAYPRRTASNGIVIAVGSNREPDYGFGIYVSSDGKKVYSGKANDERLSIELRRAFGMRTLQMARQRLI